MQPIENDQEAYLNMLKQEHLPHTFRCGNCGAWQGDEHEPTCAGPKPVVVQLRDLPLQP